MTYSADDTKALNDAARSIRLGNNGYSDLHPSFPERLIPELEALGFVVIWSTDLHGKPVLRGFTPAGQKALKSSVFGVSTYKNFTINTQITAKDYEGAILARDENRGIF